MKNLKINFSHVALFTLVSFFLNACVSPQKLVEQGNYDSAIIQSVKKLSGKKNKKVKYVLALEEAFEKATRRDMQRAEMLKRENRPENWAEINAIYRGIRKRQERIEPLLPLVDQEGIKANFRFVRVDGLERESKEKAAAYLYDQAQELLVDARQGDKYAARQAFTTLEKIDNYYRDYKDKRYLMNQAKDLGMVHILFKMQNNARVILPSDFERELKRISVRDMDSEWKTFHLRPVSGLNFDYSVVMNITDVEVSPAMVKERVYEDSREIEDGFVYVLDENGNVAKDSLGNDIKEPNFVIVRAKVLETFQNKFAAVEGRLEIIDNRNNQLVDSKPLAVEAIFENYASTFRGDDRALSKESKRRIGNQPLPFPTDEAMIFQAAEQLKPLIKNKMSKTRIFI